MFIYKYKVVISVILSVGLDVLLKLSPDDVNLWLSTLTLWEKENLFKNFMFCFKELTLFLSVYLCILKAYTLNF